MHLSNPLSNTGSLQASGHSWNVLRGDHPASADAFRGNQCFAIHDHHAQVAVAEVFVGSFRASIAWSHSAHYLARLAISVNTGTARLGGVADPLVRRVARYSATYRLPVFRCRSRQALLGRTRRDRGGSQKMSCPPTDGRRGLGALAVRGVTGGELVLFALTRDRDRVRADWVDAVDRPHGRAGRARGLGTLDMQGVVVPAAGRCRH